jgi:S-DNA-T family DNA segregation ATPase FtsK/SpoIIIE
MSVMRLDLLADSFLLARKHEQELHLRKQRVTSERKTPAEIRSSLNEHAARLIQAVGNTRVAADATHELASARQTSADEAIAEGAASSEMRVRQEAAHEWDAAADRLRTIVAKLELSPATAGWASPAWNLDATDGDPASFVRLGNCAPPPAVGRDASFPLLAPVMDGGHLLVRAPREDRDSAVAMLQATLLRILASAPLGRIRYRIFDPQGLGSTFSSYGHFSQDGVAEGLPLTSAGQLDAALEELVAHATNVSATYLKSAYSNLTEFLRSAGRGASHYQVLILLDFPAGVRRETAERISRLAYEGPSRGVCLLVHHDTCADADGSVALDLGASSTVIDRVADGWQSSSLPGVNFQPDRTPPVDLVVQVAARSMAPPSRVGFELIISDVPEGTSSSAGGLTTVVGTSGLEPVSLTLGDQPVHALIGGGSGMGKSNLLRALVYGLAHRYQPSELELYLLDFKEGVEFKEFAGARSWLPHARVVSVNSDRAFGTAVLEHLAGETKARYEKLGARNLRKLEELRAAEPDAELQRILLVIDEFHVLFGRPDEYTERSLEALNVLARQGRAAGVHVALASQTVSDVGRGMGASSKFDGIFGQFALRVALHTTPSESQAILQTGNKAAAELHEQGVAIVNRSLGSPEHNQRTVIAHVDDEQAREVRQQLCSAYGATRRPPRIFDGGELADPTQNASIQKAVETRSLLGRSLHTWVGEPMTLDPDDPSRATELAARFTADQNRHLGVLGLDVAEASSILQWATLGLALQSDPARTSFTLLDLLREDDSLPPRFVAATAGLLERLGHHCSIVAAGDVAANVIELSSTLNDAYSGGDTRYVVGFGLDRAPSMNREIPGEGQYSRGSTPTDSLRALIADGAINGTHLLGWWTTLNAFVDQVGRQLSNVGMLALLRVPQKEIRLVIPAAPDWEGGPNRALWFDRDDTTPIPFVPYKLADAAGLERLGPNESAAV